MSESRLSAKWGAFFAVPSSVLNADLSSNAKLVFIALCSYVGPGGDAAWPSYRSLSSRTSMSEPTIRRALAELQEAGWVIVEAQRREDGGQGPNRYVLQVPAHEKIDTPREKSDTPPGQDLKGGLIKSDTRGVPKNGGGAAAEERSADPTRSIEQDSKNNTTDPVVCVLNTYKEVTGLSDLTGTTIRYWLRSYSVDYVLSKIRLLEKCYAQVKVPLAWLSKAIRHDWIEPGDADSARQARLEEARRNKEERLKKKLAEMTPPDPVAFRDNLEKAKEVLRRRNSVNHVV